MSIEYFAQFAPILFNQGYDVLPVRAGEKRPLLEDWTNTTLDLPTIESFADNGKASCSVGLKTGRVSGIDIDVTDKVTSNALVNFLYSQVGEMPLRTGQKPKCLLVARSSDPKRRKRFSATYEDYLGEKHRIEILGAGQQFVTYGRHPNGNTYEWWNRDLSQTAIDQLPILEDADIDALFTRFDELARDNEWTLVQSGRTGFDRDPGWEPKAPRGEPIERIREALRHIDPTPYDDWIACGMGLQHEYGDDGYELWDNWSSLAHNYPGSHETWRKWNTFTPDGKTTIGTVMHMAAVQGWQSTSLASEFPDLTSLPNKPISENHVLENLTHEQNQELTEVTPPESPLGIRPVTQWQGHVPKDREWVIEGLVPRGEVTGLYGDGGVGKTMVAQEMQTCIALGIQFYGKATTQGTVLGVYCEDKPEELHRRQQAINGKYVLDHKDLPNSYILSRAGLNNLLITFDGNDKGVPTQFWKDLNAEIERMCISAVSKGMSALFIDTGADTFGGNENIRNQVRQFIQVALGYFAVKYNIAVVVLLHPSVAGSATGTGGSTAWNASVRSRLHFFRDETNPDIRRLRVRKSNYAPTGDDATDIQMIWSNGCFVDIASGGNFVETIEAEANRVFIDLLSEINQRGDHVSTSTRGNYAPRVMVQMARARGLSGFSVGRFETAMEQLLHRGVVEVEEGRRGRSTRLVVSLHFGGEDGLDGADGEVEGSS